MALTCTLPTTESAGQLSALNCSCEQKPAACGLPSRPGGSRTKPSFTLSVLFE